MKIIMYMRKPRLRASLEARWQRFFELFVTDPPRGQPFGAGAIIVQGRVLKKYRIIAEWFNFLGKRSS